MMTSPHVLIVDDQPDILMLLDIFFKQQGFTVSKARDGQAGIDKAREVSPDVIIMDIQMPRKTGLEAVRELRADERFVTTPIIALTAYAHVHVPVDMIRAGFDHALFKPIDFIMLQKLIADALEQDA